MANVTRNAPQKSRFFSCVTYCSVAELEYMLEKKRPLIKEWAYILHNQDTYTEIDYLNYEQKHETQPEWQIGEKKKDHIHLLCRLYQPITLSSFRRLMKPKDDNITAQFVLKEDAIKEYLIHEGIPYKHQYGIDEVKASNIEWFLGKSERDKPKDKANEILELLSQGARPWDIASIYGREFILNFRKYYEFHNFASNYELDQLYREFENERSAYYNFKNYGVVNTDNVDVRIIQNEIERLKQLEREIINGTTRKS